MKVVLINPPDITVGKVSSTGYARDPPLGLAYIASALESANHRVQIIDCIGSLLNWDEMCERLSRSNPDLIGITTHTRVLPSAFELARRSKEIYPEIPVVLGGHGVYLLEDRILRERKSVDIIVRGEGDESTVELADALEDGTSIEDIPGICFRNGSDSVKMNPTRPFIKNLDQLPLPARHLLPMESYIRDFSGIFKGTALVSSRGCPFLCVFCEATRFYGHSWRPRSPESVVDEMEHLHREYGKMGLNGFNIADDNFMADPKRVMKICDLMVDRGLSHLNWMCEGRVDSNDEALYSKMYEAGCRIVYFGIESGNDQILKKIRKGITTEMARRAVKMANAVGFKTRGYFLFGLPGDTDETMMDTIRFSEELDLDSVELHPVQMYPGTDLGREQSIDWLNFLVEEDRHVDFGEETGFAGFHPCVPTYGDRDRMKEIMKYVTRRKVLRKARETGLPNVLRRGLTHPREAVDYLHDLLRIRDRLPD